MWFVIFDSAKKLRKRFHMIQRFLRSELSSSQFENDLKTDIVSSKQLLQQLSFIIEYMKKIYILVKLSRKKDIVIARPDK